MFLIFYPTFLVSSFISSISSLALAFSADVLSLRFLKKSPPFLSLDKKKLDSRSGVYGGVAEEAW
jgi:hypothetical protein